MLLLPNLYGNILNNIACGLVGGPGLTSGQNYGHEYAVFETVSCCCFSFCCLYAYISISPCLNAFKF